MKTIKELMEELGFNKEASVDVQKAFIKHLINAANQTSSSTKVEKSAKLEAKDENNKQLEFDFSDTKRVS